MKSSTSDNYGLHLSSFLTMAVVTEHREPVIVPRFRTNTMDEGESDIEGKGESERASLCVHHDRNHAVGRFADTQTNIWKDGELSCWLMPAVPFGSLFHHKS